MPRGAATRRADKTAAPFNKYYELIFRGYTDDDKVSRKD